MKGVYVDAFGQSAYETLADKLGLEEDTEEFQKFIRKAGESSGF